MPPRRTTPANGSRPRPAARPKAAPEPGFLTFKGEKYKLDSKVGIWPLIQFARSAESGLTIIDQRGLAAVHAFLQDVIDPEDWGRFQEDMIKKKVSDLTELLDTAQQAVSQLLERQNKTAAKRGQAEIVESTTE
jgi:hypothetical protein